MYVYVESKRGFVQYMGEQTKSGVILNVFYIW
jgi:hypothetical protein